MTAASEFFRERFGHDPDGVWVAPGRVNLIGEHTDYNGGLVLPFAIDRCTEAAIAVREDDRLRVCSSLRPRDRVETGIAELAPGAAPPWWSHVLGVPWVLAADRGLDIAVTSTVPLGSGLSSSSALICSVMLGISELLETGHSRRELVALAQRTENEFVGAPTGRMDHVASLFGEAGHALLYDVESGDISPLPFEPSAAGLTVLVVDTRVRHDHAAGEYRARRADCEKACRILGVESLRRVDVEALDVAATRLHHPRLVRRVRHVVTENERVRHAVEALRAGDWPRLGLLLEAAHVSIRDDYEASCDELDLAVATLTRAGAIGARMTGGGFGGCAVAVVPDERVPQVIDAVAAAFAAREYDHPESFTVIPAAGARRAA